MTHPNNDLILVLIAVETELSFLVADLPNLLYLCDCWFYRLLYSAQRRKIWFSIIHQKLLYANHRVGLHVNLSRFRISFDLFLARHPITPQVFERRKSKENEKNLSGKWIEHGRFESSKYSYKFRIDSNDSIECSTGS